MTGNKCTAAASTTAKSENSAPRGVFCKKVLEFGDDPPTSKDASDGATPSEKSSCDGCSRNNNRVNKPDANREKKFDATCENKSDDNSQENVNHVNEQQQQQTQQQLALLLVNLYSLICIFTKIQKCMTKTIFIIAVPGVFAFHVNAWWLLCASIIYVCYQLWVYVCFVNQVLSKVVDMNNTLSKMFEMT